MITGRGMAKNRALSGVTCTAPASPTRRATPAATGIKVSAISAAGTPQLDRAERVVFLRRVTESFDIVIAICVFSLFISLILVLCDAFFSLIIWRQFN